MIVSPICEMIGIEYPIFQGGMAWIADGKLAAAVSNGGGLGIISAMNAGGDYLREQIRIARELTDKPFGVNIMLMSPHVDEVAKIVAEEKVAVVTTGAGMPKKGSKHHCDSCCCICCSSKNDGKSRGFRCYRRRRRIRWAYRGNDNNASGASGMRRCEHSCTGSRRHR